MYSHSRLRSLSLVFSIVLMEFTAFGMIIPLSPYLARDFGADDLEVGLLMSVYSLAQLIFAPLWGLFKRPLGPKAYYFNLPVRVLFFLLMVCLRSHSRHFIFNPSIGRCFWSGYVSVYGLHCRYNGRNGTIQKYGPLWVQP